MNETAENQRQYLPTHQESHTSLPQRQERSHQPDMDEGTHCEYQQKDETEECARAWRSIWEDCQGIN